MCTGIKNSLLVARMFAQDYLRRRQRWSKNDMYLYAFKLMFYLYSPLQS